MLSQEILFENFKFLNILKNFICQCGHIYLDPFICPECPQNFCKICYKNDKICPNCNNTTLIPNTILSNKISELKCICLYCEEELLMKETKNHPQNMEEHLVKCTACEFKDMKSKTIQHEDECKYLYRMKLEETNTKIIEQNEKIKEYENMLDEKQNFINKLEENEKETKEINLIKQLRLDENQIKIKDLHNEIAQLNDKLNEISKKYKTLDRIVSENNIAVNFLDQPQGTAFFNKDGTFIPPFGVKEFHIIAIGGGAGGGAGGTGYRGGGGSGYVICLKTTIDIPIKIIVGEGGKGGSYVNTLGSVTTYVHTEPEKGKDTRFGDIIAKGGLCPKNTLLGGDGWSGGGAGGGSSSLLTGGTGGKNGSNGQDILPWKGGNGTKETFHYHNVSSGEGGKGGSSSNVGHPGGGGGGGIIVEGFNLIYAQNGDDVITNNNGKGGQGYGAGGGGGGFPAYTKGGDGASGCVYISW